LYLLKHFNIKYQISNIVNHQQPSIRHAQNQGPSWYVGADGAQRLRRAASCKTRPWPAGVDVLGLKEE